MSLPTRPLSTHMRAPSGPVSQAPALAARIDEKRAELEHLKELRDLSSAVATQMEALEQRLSTLSGGAQAISAVMDNWHSVLRAINMASAKLVKTDKENALPQTLVRIPTEHAPTLQAQAEAADVSASPEATTDT
ncbi:DASH complex subunit DAD2 [Ophiocordyceps camponoti-floridani]|uniref:DASH complex subunit DAD2 n=1 Tax=Ophiocordyceps camponoti-floridani TaxID=2030778 RepID=A0A8H4QE86_9HYPO|nr:DASH complex subunit DAD2 [Ophiocordyceps camponoti-floridani]